MPIVLVHLNSDVRERRLLVHDGAALEIRSAHDGDGDVVLVTANGASAQLDNRSPRLRCLINGIEIRQATITPGDTVQIGRERYVVETQNKSAAESTRSSRRVSAARITSVTPDGRKGFLRRVGRLLNLRNQRAARLRQLEQERAQLLQDAGRCALRPDAGLGLPESALAALHAGSGVILSPGEVSTVHLERWAELRHRGAFIDAEIAALRNELGLGPDPDRLSDPMPTLRVDQKLQQDRCFRLLDDHDTQQIPTLDSLPSSVTPVRVPVRPPLRR